MINFRKKPFWEKISFGRPGLNALFQHNASADIALYDDEFDKDSDSNVVITPAPDYDTKSFKSFRNFPTMKGRSKKIRKSTGYSYESDDNEKKSHQRKRHHQHASSRCRNHSPQRDERLFDNSDSSVSSGSTCNTVDYREERSRQKAPKEKGSRMWHCSPSDGKQRRKSGTRSLKKCERASESSPVCNRKNEREIPLERRHVIATTKTNGKTKYRSEMNRERQDKSWDSYASDSSPERTGANLTKNRKQAKPKKSKKMSLSDTDVEDNWTIRKKSGKPSDGVMLKITMDDLRNVLTENVLSAVMQGMDDGRGKQRVQCVSPEVLTTDTETLNSGYSAGSGNSTEALLPLISGRRMSSAFQPVPQRQSGMLKRFIPVLSSSSSDNTGMSRNSSVATVKTLLSGTSDLADMTARSKTTGYGGGFGTVTANYDQLEDKLMTQTSSLRGRHMREPTGEIYEDSILNEAIHQHFSAKEDRHSYFQDGQSSGSNLSPRLSMDLTDELGKGPCGLQDVNGRRMSTTFNSFQNGQLNSDSDLQNIKQRRESMHQNFGSALPTCFDHMSSRRPSLCIDTGFYHINDFGVPGPAYLARRRQSLPVNLTSYPYSELATIGMEAIMTATEAKVQPSKKEKSKIEKSLSTVPEESVDAIEDKPRKDTQEKMNTKSTKELLKNIKETAKEKRKFRVTKSLALLSSILVVMAGIGVLCLGILNMMDGEAQMYVAVTKKGPKDNSFQYYCYGLCFIGASVLLVCLCGCIGALKINTCLLKMFIVSLVLLLTLNGVMVTMVVVSQKDLPSIPLLAAVEDGVKDVVLDHMKANLQNSYKAGSLVARAWDQLQVQMECCGCQSQNDYKYSAWWNVTSDSKTNMPDSCCIVAVKDIDDLKPTNKFLCQSMTPGFWHNTGCHDVLMVWYKQNSVMAFGATMGLVALEILSLICTVRLYRSLTQKTATSASNI